MQLRPRLLLYLWQMTHGVLSSLPSQLPRKRKGSRTKERAGRTSLKEPKEMERVMLLVALPSARTESVTLSDYTLHWQAGPNRRYQSISSVTCCGARSQTAGASPGAQGQIPEM